MGYEDEMKALKDLFDSGVLAADEYNKRKETLLRFHANAADQQTQEQDPNRQHGRESSREQGAGRQFGREQTQEQDPNRQHGGEHSFGGASDGQKNQYGTHQQSGQQYGQNWRYGQQQSQNQQYGWQQSQNQQYGQQQSQNQQYGWQQSQNQQYGQQQSQNQQYGWQQSQHQQRPYWQPPLQSGQKSKIVAGLLGIFLGSLGIHNFYLGYKGKAIAQLLLSVLSFGVLAIVSGIWGLIEGIMILCGSIRSDANGVPLRE
jgi:TM2 domain-containing membrane protein YozV